MIPLKNPLPDRGYSGGGSPFIAGGGAGGPKHLARLLKRSDFEKIVVELIDKTFEPRLLHTVRGVGYRFDH